MLCKQEATYTKKKKKGLNLDITCIFITLVLKHQTTYSYLPISA